ncbi:MAG: TonB-dependent receptor [Verrucomicrobia bacterium]|nr:TonB-dependent receptor [Verrucomicrobiota bacterium]
MKAAIAMACALLPLTVRAQGTVTLPKVTVHSPRVANQTPAGAFAMPVSALRFEPQVDLHARNLAEGQADVTIRGGIFENTGFKLGASTTLDPQTGHYFAEIPVAPAMLSAPEIVTGADLALSATNSTAGAVAYGWRPVRTTGAASLAVGTHDLRRAEIYQGFSSGARVGGLRLAADVAAAHSESEGSIALGDHRFERVNLRLQLAGTAAQTDLFAGYQAKFFGWPNLYTPFNSNETENLQTVLVALNHRADLGGGDFFEAGASYRRNKDDYAFNRFAAVGAVHPFQHTTWVRGAAVSGRRTVGELALQVRAEVLADELRSTSLTFGRFHARTVTRFGFVPEKTWNATDGSRTTVKAGATHDDTNRGGAALSPVFEIARAFPAATLRRIYASYTQTTQIPTYTALNSSAAAGLFRGNPNLGRETSRNFEIGASGAIAGWSGQAAVFWRRDDALVDWTFRRGVTARAANPVDIGIGGFEAVARRSWPAGDVVLGYTALSKDADYRGAAVDASFYALNYARHRFTAAFTFRLGHGIELRLDNVARVQAANLLRVTGGNETIVSSAGLAYRPGAMRGLEISLQIDNLWDSDFQEVPAVPAARRQVSAGAAYAW